MSLNQHPLSAADLLRAVKELNNTELEQFVSQVLIVRAQQRTRGVSQTEANLLQRINAPIPDETLTRYRELIALRHEERFTPDEQNELIRIADDVEQFNNHRISALAELAKLRGTTLTKVMDDLQIKPLPYE